MSHNHLNQMWEEARLEYTRITGQSTAYLPDHVTPETLSASLDRQKRAYNEWTSEEQKLWSNLNRAGNWAGPVVSVVMSLATGVPAPISGPTQVVLGALQFAIQATNGVSDSLEQVMRILERLRNFSDRMKHYSELEKHSPELSKILVSQLTIVLRVCALATRQMQETQRNAAWARAKTFTKHAFSQQDDVIGLLDQLDQDTRNEQMQTGTETYVVTMQNTAVLQDSNRKVEALERRITEQTQAFMELIAARTTKKESLSLDRFFKHRGADKIRSDAATKLGPVDFARNELERMDKVNNAVGAGAGLGDWIRQEKLYLDLTSGDQKKLFVSGMSGSGKSFLAHNVVSHLRTDETVYVGYYFFSREADKAVTPAKAICTMASQIASNSTAYSRHIMENCRGVQFENFDAAWKLLFEDKFVSGHHLKRPVYLIIDALDSLPADRRSSICAKLQQIGSGTMGLKVMVFGRPEIREELGRNIPSIEVESSRNGEAVTRYVLAKLSNMGNLKRLPYDSQDRIARAVSEKADGLFVWADLALDEIERKDESSESAINAILQNVPGDLEAALSHSLEQVAASLSPDKLLELNCILAWVACSKEPMTLELLNSFHRLDGTRKGGDVQSLRDSLLRYSTIFRLEISEDVWIDEKEGHSNSMPALQRVKSEQDRLEDLVCYADPKSVSVGFYHTSVLDYIRSDRRRPVNTVSTNGTEENRIASIYWAHQKICCCLMQLLLQTSSAGGTNQVMRYAERYWLAHLSQGFPADSAARLEIKQITELLYSIMVKDNLFPSWLRHLEHNELNYGSAKTVAAILTDQDADALFQDKYYQKWRKQLTIYPLKVFEHAMMYCGKTWLKMSPPSVHLHKYAVAAITYHDTPKDSTAWKVYPANYSVTSDDIESAAKHYTGKRDAIFKCRLARALLLARDGGPQKGEFALRKVKDPEVRWEADFDLARLHLSKSQLDHAEHFVNAALDGLAALASQNGGQRYYSFIYDCNKLSADCLKQKTRALQSQDPLFNQYSIEAAERMRRAMRIQPTDLSLLSEAISLLHGVALRLMVEGKMVAGRSIDAEDFLDTDSYSSDEAESHVHATRASSGPSTPLTSKSFKDITSSRERPGLDDRTLSSKSVASSTAASERRHKLSTSSLGNAGFFRAVSHGSNRRQSSMHGSLEDQPDSLNGLSDDEVYSPPLYLDNFDEQLSNSLCHHKVMRLLRDLDSNPIIGNVIDDGFGFQIDNTNRLYMRLAQIVQRDPKLVKLMAFAACMSEPEDMTWLVELFERAVVFEGRRKQQRQLMLLKTHLGSILSVYAGQHDDAIRLWESVVQEPLGLAHSRGHASLPQVEASKHLSRLCISRASLEPSRADEYVDILRRFSDSTLSPLSSQIGTERAQSKIHLATWYHNKGDVEKAKSLARDDVLWALDILTDEDPANDFDGFYVLANALRAVQDDSNHLAARHAMRQYDGDSAIPTAGKKQKTTHNTDAFCSGLCLQEHKQWDNMRLCRSCPDLNLCRNCFELFTHDELYLKICDPTHDFLSVPTMKQPFIRGNQVVVDGHVVNLDDWTAGLRKTWEVPNTPQSPSRWRRHSSKLSITNTNTATNTIGHEPAKAERKRDAFKRMFSHK